MKYLAAFIFSIFFITGELQALDVPRLTAPVVDRANVLSSGMENRINRSLIELNKNGVQFQVLTVKSLDGEPIENYSIKVTDEWKLGTKEAAKGALLLIAVQDRKMRIEVGQGLEGELTDLDTGRIIDGMKPYFRANDFDGGTYFAVHMMAKKAGYLLKAPTRRMRRKKQRRGFGFGTFILIFIILRIFGGRGGNGGGGSGVPWLLLGMLSGGSRGSYGGGGFSSSGGGWSGGGGGFSGGGASGDW